MGYPTNIAIFTPKVNNVDKVVADDVNVIYTEVTEIEKHLGVGGAAYSSGWGTGTFSTSITNWYSNGGLKARIQNIENGLIVAYNATSTITSNAGGSTITPSTAATVGLTIKAQANQTAYLINFTDNAGTTSLARVEQDGRFVASVISGGTA
jgi:hypothetical protein